ncbi:MULTISPECIES: nucleotidyltransferase domain-containing protein [unclassified Ochrobactrum]|uniref:nucleotidyltransferase domain-containing protein n=1 Tax=unclassified Ochrobactrum TaxID=239106 RepID=UPI000DEEFF66|nr:MULTISPECIES: nucleotidyltransferase domain-containing protein [unclassified Ochrobactrum]MBQ0707992.1 nucleotidyltransferase domain-containing protein [Ochrobactrum sp. AP1BH01-1]
MNTSLITSKFSKLEAEAVDQFFRNLRKIVGVDLQLVGLFGSMARGEAWAQSSTNRSDIDLLIVTENSLDKDTRQKIDEWTYDLFLYCGRQISPQYRDAKWMQHPPDQEAKDFIETLKNEMIPIYIKDD